MSHDFLFYLQSIASGAVELRLEGEEHHHLARVVRMKPGDTAFVTDGTGTIVECRVRSVEKSHTMLDTVCVRERVDGKPLPVLALGCIKKERFERAVAYGTELGIERCIPLVSVNSSASNYHERYLARLRAIALAAMKQSFRAVLPEIESPLPFDGLLERLPRFDVVFAGSQAAPPLLAPRSGGRAMILVGPESGFAPDELRKLEHAGATFASVSSRRLRSETAALAMLSIVNSPREDRQSD